MLVFRHVDVSHRVSLRPIFSTDQAANLQAPSEERVMKADVTGPDSCYCLASRRSARFLTRLYEQHLKPAGLTASQFSILSFLDHQPGMTVAELADALEMERTTLVRALTPLRARGLINEGSKKLGRAATLYNTRPGTTKLSEASLLWQDAQTAFENHVGRDAAMTLRDMTASVRR